MKIYVTLITKTVYLATIFINSLFAQTQQEIDMELERLNQAIQGNWVLSYNLLDYEREGYDIGIADSTFISEFKGNYRFHYYNDTISDDETATFRIYYGKCNDWGSNNKDYFIEYCYEKYGCFCLPIHISQDENQLFIQTNYDSSRGVESRYFRKEYYFDNYVKKDKE